MDITASNKALAGLAGYATAIPKFIGALTMVCGLMACGVSDRIGKQVNDTWAGDMLHADNEQVVLTSDGGNQLNPDATGAPLSVVLRVYQLKALERFASASADGLWHAPDQVLGNSLIESDELTVLPGLGHVDRWPLNKAARYVGVAAFFRENADERWKVAFDANALRKDGILFSSNGMRVLVDRNEVMATRGIDVLGKPKALELSAESLKSPGLQDTAGPLTSMSKTPLESIE